MIHKLKRVNDVCFHNTHINLIALHKWSFTNRSHDLQNNTPKLRQKKLGIKIHLFF